MIYLITKALHLICVLSWVAGLVIYPRYKLHQLKSQPGEALFDVLQDASARLRRIILTPSIILVWIFGLALIWQNPDLLQSGWLHLKLMLLLVMSAMHGYFISLGKKVDSGICLDRKRLKLFNEAPFIIAIIIVFLAVLRPF